jgi:hypothetical protein
MFENVLVGYITAHERIVSAGYGSDVDWADQLRFVKPDAVYVLREAAWVILNSGFRYAVVQKLWPRLYEAFHGFDPEKVDKTCLPAAKAVLNHPGKLGAVIELAARIRAEGHEFVLEKAKTPPQLADLHWIGKTTCWHLAKVLGVDCVKPDVHLKRAAEAAGFKSPLALCEHIGRELGERLTVIDSVLWRYGEQKVARGWPDWVELWAPRTGIEPV